MKDKKKLYGILGIIALIIIYVVLVRAGVIHPQEAEESGTGVELPIDDSEEISDQATETPEVAEVPEVTEEPKATEVPTEKPVVTAEPDPTEEPIEITDYGFRNKKLRDSHYEKHGIEMGFETVEDYILAANMVISNPDSLHKLEAEDNDHIYFLEETNEFVVLSQDGYIRTYYIASGGIDYFNRQ